MRTARIVLNGREAAAFPAIVSAAMWLPKALALKCDRIRVEKLDGARVAEWPVATVERFIRSHRLALQPDRLAKRDRDWEYRRPVFPGWRQGDSHGGE